MAERDILSNLLMQMEHVRMESYEAETKAEEHRLTREYGRLWRIVKPMLAKKHG